MVTLPRDSVILYATLVISFWISSEWYFLPMTALRPVTVFLMFRFLRATVFLMFRLLRVTVFLLFRFLPPPVIPSCPLDSLPFLFFLLWALSFWLLLFLLCIRHLVFRRLVS